MRSSHIDESEGNDGPNTDVEARECEPLVSRSELFFWCSFLVTWDFVCPIPPGQSDACTSVYVIYLIEP